MTKITTNFLRENIACSEIVKYKGNFIARQGFYYTHGKTADDFLDDIIMQLKHLDISFHIIDHGEIWKPFKGGASLKNQSHWFVKFEIL